MGSPPPCPPMGPGGGSTLLPLGLGGVLLPTQPSSLLRGKERVWSDNNNLLPYCQILLHNVGLFMNVKDSFAKPNQFWSAPAQGDPNSGAPDPGAPNSRLQVQP